MAVVLSSAAPELAVNSANRPSGKRRSAPVILSILRTAPPFYERREHGDLGDMSQTDHGATLWSKVTSNILALLLGATARRTTL